MAYQSIGSLKGDSDSIQKLIRLRLPTLKNKSFLDVGCNAGFFSGYAKYMGATRVLGIDSSRVSIDKARELFPDCDFMCLDWDDIPSEEFDVILVASVIHYSKNPVLTLEMLMTKLAPGGILVLEYGILDEPGFDFVEVCRPVGDVVMHAQRQAVITFAQKRKFLYRAIGESVIQSGDTTKRFVVHLHKPICAGIIITGLPTTGKSHLARKIAAATDTIIDLDEFLLNSKENTSYSSPVYADLISKMDTTDFSLTYQVIENDSEMAQAFWDQLAKAFSFDSDFIITGALGKTTAAKLIFELSTRGIKMTHIETQDYQTLTNHDQASHSALQYNKFLMQKT
jgi:SAM-dependent methyltransferase